MRSEPDQLAFYLPMSLGRDLLWAFAGVELQEVCGLVAKICPKLVDVNRKLTGPISGNCNAAINEEFGINGVDVYLVSIKQIQMLTRGAQR